MKKVFKPFLSGVLALSMLAGCSSTDDTTSESTGTDTGEPVDISLQIIWDKDSDRGKTVQSILDDFEKEYPDINVTLVGSSQNNQKLLTQLLSGEAPEVMQVGYRDVQSLAGEGVFYDMTEDVGDKKSVYYENVFELGMSDDKVYGMPWNGHAVGMVYNKDMFEAAGITEAPKTWDELYEVAKKLTIDTDGDGTVDQYGMGMVGKQGYDLVWNVNMFMKQAGSEFLTADNTVGLNNEAGAEGLAFYKKLLDETAPKDSAEKEGAEVMADFRNGVTAIEFQGPWGVTDIWQNENPFEVGTALMPAGPAGSFADIGVTDLCIPSTVEGEKLEASKTLINYLTDKPAQDAFVRGSLGDDGNYYPFRIPLRKDMADSAFLTEHPEFMVFIEGLATPQISPLDANWTQVENEVLTAEYSSVVIGSKTPEEALETIEEKGNSILAQ